MKKFEFVFFINKNIVCQRYFTVKNFNKQSLKSMDLIDCVKNVTDIIKKDLKNKTYDFLWGQYNPYFEQKSEDIVKDDNTVEDVFDFQIRVDEVVVAHTQIRGNDYPQRVRYSVDIRKLIPGIIAEIQNTLSKENFDVEYCGIEL
jgi:hypothetical protein